MSPTGREPSLNSLIIVLGERRLRGEKQTIGRGYAGFLGLGVYD